MGSRSIWNGTISFGLVNVPVGLHTATDEKAISFRQVHRADGGRIKQVRTCSTCDEVVAYQDIAKGYEHQDHSITVMDDTDLAALPLPTLKTIEVLMTVDPATVPQMLHSKSYYVVADVKTGKSAYALLAGALAETGLVGVCKVALRARESLALLRESDGLLILDMQLWPDEVREAPAPADVPVDPAMAKMAAALVGAMAGTFDPAAYTDTYGEALAAVVAAKAEGNVSALPAAAVPEAKDSLADALSASLAAAKAA